MQKNDKQKTMPFSNTRRGWANSGEIYAGRKLRVRTSQPIAKHGFMAGPARAGKNFFFFDFLDWLGRLLNFRDSPSDFSSQRKFRQNSPVLIVSRQRCMVRANKTVRTSRIESTAPSLLTTSSSTAPNSLFKLPCH
jgi:hypothetical protein